MNKEIEAKFKIKDYLFTKKLIEQLGFSKQGVSNTRDIYYVVPEKKPHTRYMRIRVEGTKGEFAYHEVINNNQTNEWEVNVDDYKTLGEAIEKLGFEQDVEVDKERTKFTKGPVVAVLDRVESLGNFVEIEAPDVKTLDIYIHNLGLRNKDRVVGLGYPDLLRKKINERNTQPQ